MVCDLFCAVRNGAQTMVANMVFYQNHMCPDDHRGVLHLVTTFLNDYESNSR